METNKPRKRDQEATQFARDQRSTANEFSRAVWEMVRSRRCCGEKFRREYVFGPFTLDFRCVELKLVVEVDGSDHFSDEGILYDRKRDAYLQKHGFRVLRIPGFAVLNEPGQVHGQIVEEIKLLRKEGDPSPPAPSMTLRYWHL